MRKDRSPRSRLPRRRSTLLRCACTRGKTLTSIQKGRTKHFETGTSSSANSDSSALPLTVHSTHKRPAHSHPHQPPYPKPTPPTHAGLSIGYRLRRKELLKENLAQRTDLQQEWLALIGAMDSALKSKLETRSMSNSDIRCASYACAHAAAFLLCTVPPFFFFFSSPTFSSL